MKISVIIVNYNTSALLQKAINSLYNQNIPMQLIVVDNGSNDDSVEMLKNFYPDVFLIQNMKNEKYARPHNQALQFVNGEYILLMNSDAELMEDTLNKMIDFMDKNSDVGICSPQLILPDKSIQYSCHKKMNIWTHLCDMFFLDKIFKNTKFFSSNEMVYFDHKTIKEVDHIMYAVVVVRRLVFEQVGYFDEKLTLHYNDMDFSVRTKQKGWKIVFYPQAKALHHSSSTTNKLNLNFELVEEMYDNLFYYYQKHYGKFIMYLAELFSLIGFLLRIIIWSFVYIFSFNKKGKYNLKYSFKIFSILIKSWKFF